MALLELLIESVGSAALPRSFEAESLVVGRKAGADIVVDDTSVSRQHARLFVDDGDWYVEDLQSRNGTTLNGQSLTGPARLGRGDVIRAGDTVIRLTAVGERRAGDAVIAESPTGEQLLFSVLKPAKDTLGGASADLGASSRLRMLNEVHRALAAPISRDALLQLILDRAFAELLPEDAVVFLKGEGGGLYRAAERRSPRSSGPLLLSRRLAEEVTVKGAAALVLDAQSDERFAAAESVVLSGVRSILAAPLSDAEGCLGMIALYSSAAARRFSEPDLDLLVSLASAAALRIRNIALVEQEAARRVTDRELALAREIQMGMLRRRPLDSGEVDVAARQVPARQVGGDFYEYVADEGRLSFIVADVSGKGMAAALMMAVSLTLFRGIAALRLPIGEVVARLNREIARDNERAMFVTALAGCLDLSTGRLELVNAGHNLPYLLGSDGAVRMLAPRNAVALGVLEDSAFPVTECRLERGEGLFVYTDGVCDAVDGGGGAFGVAGIERYLAEAGGASAGAILDGMLEKVATFAGGAAQEDDITVMVIRRAARDE